MKSSISAKIPTELFEMVQEAIKQEKYASNTECIIEGLNLLLGNTEREDSEDKRLLQENEKEIQILQEEVKRSKEVIQELQGEVKRSKEEVKRSKEEVNCSKEEIRILQENLKKAPDHVEFAQIQARFGGLQEIIKEKDKGIERLESELQKAGQREEDLKQMHNNYMLQVQSLINARALSTSSESTQKEARQKQESRPADGKEEIEKICKYCGQPFLTTNPKKETCSDRCRSAYSRKTRR